MANSDSHLFFESLKEDRGWYFVEYQPPRHGFQFATVQLVVLDNSKTAEDISISLEAELVIWLERYPIPIMATAFDETGTLISLEATKGCDHLFGYFDEKNHKLFMEWHLLSNEELPKAALDPSYIRKIYSEISFRTGRQNREAAEAHAKQIRLGWWVVFIWAVVVPLAVSILGWWSDWLSIIVLLYSLYKAIEKALRLMDKWPKSKLEIQKEVDLREMQHHHFHCKSNPEGFNRLKNENFQRWLLEDTHQKAVSLKNLK